MAPFPSVSALKLLATTHVNSSSAISNFYRMAYLSMLNFLPVLSIHEQRCLNFVYILWFLPVLATI